MGSDGTYRSSTNSMVTNYIPVSRVGNAEPQTLYVKNTGITASGNGVTAGFSISVFSEPTGVNTTKALYGGNPTDVSERNLVVFTYDTNGEIASIRPKSMDYDSTVYVRFCLSNTIDKSKIIISKEPIG